MPIFKQLICHCPHRTVSFLRAGSKTLHLSLHLWHQAGAGGAERGAPAHHALQDAPGHREGADPLRGLRQGQQPDDPRAAAGPVPQLPLLQTVGGRARPGGLAPGRAENVCVCLCVCVSGAPGRAESVCVCSCVCPCVCVCV